MLVPERGDISGTSVLEGSNRQQEKRMSKFAIRLLTLAMYGDARGSTHGHTSQGCDGQQQGNEEAQEEDPQRR
jgi:hypothetical protein